MSNKKNSDNKSNKKQNTKNMKINEWPRHGIQALWAFITNSHVTGFVTGKIYTGKLKNACVPGLNCYSCPGAVGACPIGSLQAVIGSWNFKDGLLCGGISYLHWSYGGKTDLRFSLSLRIDSGSAE